MEAFTFSSKGNFFNLDIKDETITFTPNGTKVKKLLGPYNKTFKFSLNKPKTITEWIAGLSNQIGIDETLLEVYKYKYQYLEDLVGKREKDKIFTPEFFDKSIYNSNLDEDTIMDYFNTES